MFNCRNKDNAKESEIKPFLAQGGKESEIKETSIIYTPSIQDARKWAYKLNQIEDFKKCGFKVPDVLVDGADQSVSGARLRTTQAKGPECSGV